MFAVLFICATMLVLCGSVDYRIRPERYELRNKNPAFVNLL